MNAPIPPPPFPKPLWLDKTFENPQKYFKTEGSQLIDIRVQNCKMTCRSGRYQIFCKE